MKSIKRKIRPFQKILIANRGEISIRVQRACKELGITSLAIYSEEDYLSLHRIKADEAYQVGEGKGPVEAYLDIEGIINIAKNNNVDAIHPGYGFLSENENFARRCKEEDIVFIGPNPKSLNLMGDKAKARNIAEKAKVPIIPGTQNFIKSYSEALKYSKKIGFPILIKAAFGGGGRGVRICYDKSDLKQNLNEAKSEALTAFGNDSILIEKYVESPKHIEIQILADKYGNVVHLYERDCSVQRRYQKVIEFAPSVSLKSTLKNQLYKSAIKIAKSCEYVNAGTVEFLVDSNDDFYFIEMNPRIQVEHTVTEQITGVDLIRSQIRVAEGYRLNDLEIGIKSQDSIAKNGFAIQSRITTENPKNNFVPDIGIINDYRSPGGFGVRLDAASAFVGATITPFYDSMLVKLITTGQTFEQATTKMLRALDEFRIRGVKTNIPFLKKVITDPVFENGDCKTTFLDTNPHLFNIDEESDNISKIIEFIADVTTNRSIQKPEKWKKIEPTSPIIPRVDSDLTPDIPTHRKIFEEKGPKALVDWILKQEKLLITDTTFRDAHQSLLATRMRTIDMLNVAGETAILGKNIFSFEMWGGATFDVCMRFLHEDPWDRLLNLRSKMPHSMFQMLLRGSNAVGYKNYPDNVVKKFIKKSATHGIDIFRIFDCFNWLPNMRLSIETVIETGKIAEAAICYTGDITDPLKTKYNIKYYVDLAKELAKLGVHIIAIKDMAGLCKPFAAKILVSEIKEATGLPVHFHTHATSGNAEATLLYASEAGADIVDSALSSLSGNTSQPSMNAIVSALIGHDRDTGLDILNLNKLSNYWETVRKFYEPFESDMKSSNADVYQFEIPGGQYTNLRAQAQSLGLGDHWEEIKIKYGEVNQLFGDIIKVTPSSKVVGDLALFLVQNKISVDEVTNKNSKLSFPQSSIDMMRGDLGQPTGGFPKKVRTAILKGEEYSESRPGESIPNIKFKPEIEKLKNQLGDDVAEKDLVSYLLYPKVFEDFYNHKKKFGDVSLLPTKTFYYGMESGEQITVKSVEGKLYQIKLLGIGEVESEGNIPFLFEVNGHPRPVRVKDSSIETVKEQRIKANSENKNEIGSPLAGKVMKIFIDEGAKVSSGEPLFIIEAMKMQTNIKAEVSGEVEKIYIKESENTEAGDLIMKLKINQ